MGWADSLPSPNEAALFLLTRDDGGVAANMLVDGLIRLL